MHPSLGERRREQCGDIITAFEACHQDTWKKLFGGCNDLKRELNMCFRAERQNRQKSNLSEAKKRRASLEEKWAKHDNANSASSTL